MILGNILKILHRHSVLGDIHKWHHTRRGRGCPGWCDDVWRGGRGG